MVSNLKQLKTERATSAVCVRVCQLTVPSSHLWQPWQLCSRQTAIFYCLFAAGVYPIDGCDSYDVFKL